MTDTSFIENAERQALRKAVGALAAAELHRPEFPGLATVLLSSSVVTVW